MEAAWWWIRNAGLTLGGVFFLLFGIQLLVAAYHLNNPSYFILTFFSSNLIILISAVLILGFVLRMVKRIRKGGLQGEETSGNKD